MDLKQNYFEIFQLSQGFEVDQDDLSARFRKLQQSVHPDRYASASDRDRRLAMQWATQVNTAYETLKAPLKRAIYLLELKGLSIASNPTLDPGFLMEQIELREALEEIEHADDVDEDAAIAQLDGFKAQAGAVLNQVEAEFDSAWAAEDTARAEQAVYKMQFMNKLLVAADHVEEKLLDY